MRDFNLTLEEVKAKLVELNDINEWGLYRIHESNNYYTPIYVRDEEWNADMNTSYEYIGYFVIYAKGKPALLPFVRYSAEEVGAQQIVLHACRYATEDDASIFMDLLEELERKQNVLRKSIQYFRIPLLVSGSNLSEEYIEEKLEQIKKVSK